MISREIEGLSGKHGLPTQPQRRHQCSIAIVSMLRTNVGDMRWWSQICSMMVRCFFLRSNMVIRQLNIAYTYVYIYIYTYMYIYIYIHIHIFVALYPVDENSCWLWQFNHTMHSPLFVGYYDISLVVHIVPSTMRRSQVLFRAWLVVPGCPERWACIHDTHRFV